MCFNGLKRSDGSLGSNGPTRMASPSHMPDLTNMIEILICFAGDLVYANVAGTNIIFINSLATAYEIFEVRGANFSDRASMFFLCEMVGWKHAPSLQNAGPVQTAHRRSILREIGSKRNIAEVEDTITKATLKCLRGMMDVPEQLPDHIRMYVR
jgi:hypothetical protein